MSSTRLRCSIVSSFKPWGYFSLFMKLVQTSVVMVKPGGTGMLRLTISARLAPLPPRSSFMAAVPSALLPPKK